MQSLDKEIIPKGYRILGKTGLNSEEIVKLIKEFNNLDKILKTDNERLFKVLGTNCEKFNKEIINLKENILIGKRI